MNLDSDQKWATQSSVGIRVNTVLPLPLPAPAGNGLHPPCQDEWAQRVPLSPGMLKIRGRPGESQEIAGGACPTPTLPTPHPHPPSGWRVSIPQVSSSVLLCSVFSSRETALPFYTAQWVFLDAPFGGLPKRKCPGPLEGP